MTSRSSFSPRAVWAGGLAGALFFSNTAGLYAAERNYWEQRRAGQQKTLSAQSSMAHRNAAPWAVLPETRPINPVFSRLSALPKNAGRSLAWLPAVAGPFGDIRDVHFAGPNAPWVFHIQDAHDVEEAQLNIASLVGGLVRSGEVRLVGLEGATGPLTLDPFQKMPFPAATRAALNVGLSLGYIGGAELAAFDSPSCRLWGVEDYSLYRRHLKAFENGQTQRPHNTAWLNKMVGLTQPALGRCYGPLLKEFENHRSAYADGRESLSQWVSYLWPQRPKDGGFPQLARLSQVLAQEGALPFDQVEKERRRLAEGLASALPAGELQTLTDRSLDQKSGRLSFADYYRYLSSLCEKYGLPVGPHLTAYIRYLSEADQIKPGEVLDELTQLELDVEKRLALRADERDLAQLRRDLAVEIKLVQSQLTPAEWRRYDSHRPDPAGFAGRMARWGGGVPLSNGLTDIRDYEEFSRCALERNDKIAANLLSQMRADKATSAVLVTGGFHTEGLTESLRRSNVSYVVLTPRITRIPEKSQVLASLVRPPLPLEKLLVGDVIQLAAPRLTTPGPLSRPAGSSALDTVNSQRIALGHLAAAMNAVASSQTGQEINPSALQPLLNSGYLTGQIDTSPIALPASTRGRLNALRVGVEKAEFVLVWAKTDDLSDRQDMLDSTGISGEPKQTTTVNLAGQSYTVFFYSPHQVIAPSWFRQALKRLYSLVRESIAWLGRFFKEGLYRLLQSSTVGKLFPGLVPSYVVPPGDGLSRKGGVQKRLADIFPATPNRWTAVQRESLQFVMASLSADEHPVQWLESSSNDEGLVFGLVPSGNEAGAPSTPLVRFVLDPALPAGELYSLVKSRGPPEIALSPLLFRADLSSLKPHLSAAVQTALSQLDDFSWLVTDSAAYQAAQKAVQSLPQRPTSWLDENQPALGKVSLFSRSMESIFNRTLAERLQARFGFDLLRYLSQTNFTGGLGHVTYDYHESLGQDGADVASVFPLWNGIKGIVRHPEGGVLKDGALPLPNRSDGGTYESMGEMLRDVMSPAPVALSSYRIPDNAAFWDWVSRGSAGPASAFREQCRKTLDLRGRDIFFDVYAVQAKYSGQPIFYLDAYVKEGDRQVRVFDELYGDPPDAPWRAVQVLVYSQASQRLMEELVKEGYAQPRLVSLDHEVFAQFPDTYLFWQGVKGRIRHVTHAFNHTVFRPGLWNAPQAVSGLLGLDNRRDLDEWGTSIARAANERAGAVTGVSRIHWRVLLENLFGMEGKRKVVDRFDPLHPDQGMSSTNGVLLEHWQGAEVRRLIDRTKEEVGLLATAQDDVFFRTLEESSHRPAFLKFQKRFELVKALYAFDLLIFLHETQTQPQGGGAWLAQSLGDLTTTDQSRFTLESVRGHQARWRLLMDRAFRSDRVWETMEAEFGSLTEALMKRPIVANVRRQVSYKGPDMYKDILANDKEKFRESGVRLLFGGRTFGQDARGLFDYAKSLGADLGSMAFLENYNSEDAPMIFRGAMGSVMLSNENVEAAATSNSKIVVNGGWLISVFDGASPERLVVYETKTGSTKFAIAYTHDELRAGLQSGVLKILNGALVEFDDTSRSQTDGKGAGRRPSRAGLLACFSDLSQLYQSKDERRRTLYNALRWSYTADIHRQTRAFMDIEKAILDEDQEVDRVAGQIVNQAELSAVADQLRALLFKKGPSGFVWRHRHNRIVPAGVEGVGQKAGWAGFLEGFRGVKSRYYYQGEGTLAGDRDGQGLWSLQHHVMGEKGNNELIDYVNWLMTDLPAFEPLREALHTMGVEKNGTLAADRDVRVAETLKAIEFVQRTIDRVSQDMMRRDLAVGESVAQGVRSDGATLAEVQRQNYSYTWRQAVSPSEPNRDFDYWHSGPGLIDLRDSLRLMLLEGSQGADSLKHASYGRARGGYFLSSMGDRWSAFPTLRSFVFGLADELERIKSEAGDRGWQDPAVQWSMNRLYVQIVGALDVLAQPGRPGSHVMEDAATAVVPEIVGQVDRVLLGGPAEPISIHQLTTDVDRIRENVQAGRSDVAVARARLTELMGSWPLGGPAGSVSEADVAAAGRSLSQRLRTQNQGDDTSSQDAAQSVYAALVTLAEGLAGVSVEDWRRWAGHLIRGFNEGLTEAAEAMSSSIDQKKPIVFELTSTLLSGQVTAEDRSRLAQLEVMAARSNDLVSDQVTWVLSGQKAELDSFWAAHPSLASLKEAVGIVSKDLVRDGSVHSVKRLLLTSQKRERVDQLRPADLYLANRSEWVVEPDLPENLARLLIALAGGLVYDATTSVANDLRQLFYVKTNA